MVALDLNAGPLCQFDFEMDFQVTNRLGNEYRRVIDRNWKVGVRQNEVYKNYEQWPWDLEKFRVFQRGGGLMGFTNSGFRDHSRGKTSIRRKYEGIRRRYEEI